MYTLKSNRTSIHIQGLTERSKGSEMNYAQSACASLTRSGHRMSAGASFDTPAEALKAARLRARASSRKVCKNCEAAAGAVSRGNSMNKESESFAGFTDDQLEVLDDVFGDWNDRDRHAEIESEWNYDQAQIDTFRDLSNQLHIERTKRRLTDF